ncbi:MAG: hypothetical protein UT36_C0009G0028 [Candidatus Peregrinibacteria bacterium GW2011_GWF2_39_17]|nr:MAG: hypothetical protein UT36_C0009G0028 [Candidatus Peregrinibacteria bacterium GW2011_GWF2_39_17]HCW32728.1 hypothetical protein [Candidatus Peregrinibacteria bacterium]
MLIKYCFHLGREEKLSLAELETIFRGMIIESHNRIAIIEIKNLSDPQKLLNELGGILKISEIFKELGENQENLIEQSLIKALKSQKPTGKLIFGLNVAPQDDHFLNKTLKNLKQILKSKGRNPRFINKLGNLNTAIIVKSGLMKYGTDFNIIRSSLKTYLSGTVAIQNVHNYSQRDYEKPVRLDKEGMLPPKLAQLMINLTGLTNFQENLPDSYATNYENFGYFENLKNKTLYDPFCGSGTVLGEGLIKGMNIIGSDLEPKAIEAAIKNLTWLEQKKFFNPEQTKKLFIKDVTTLTNTDLPKSPDCVVSEVYLGPAQTKSLRKNEIENIHTNLLALYQKGFQALHPLLIKHTPLVIAFPLYYDHNKKIPIPNLKEILEKIGYNIAYTTIYHRPEQIVGREIFVMERV